jgi:hypothetical protein
LGQKFWDFCSMLCTIISTSWFYYSPYGFLGLEISTSTAESIWGLGFVYIISLFSCSFSYFSLFIYKYFSHRNNNRKEENPTENLTIHMVSKIYKKINQWKFVHE